MPALKIQILVDNSSSWIIPYATELTELLKKKGHQAILIHDHEEVDRGDILCLLACEKIHKKLDCNKHNLVVHESDLPKGKGWSPVTWQVLEGKNKIPVTLFEAAEAVDAGRIYAQEYMELSGTELLPEIKHKQGLATQKLILDFIDRYPEVKGKIQEGESTYYPRRGPLDSELNPDYTLKDQFDLFRVCDNERYPAFFVYRGQKYKLKIYRYDEED